MTYRKYDISIKFKFRVFDDIHNSDVVTAKIRKRHCSVLDLKKMVRL
jgi:hypothetical protein